MKASRLRLAICVCVAISGFAQEPLFAQTAAAVPPLVSFSGAVRDASGKPLAGSQALTFSIYTDETSRTPLWQETQNVQADEQGRYTVHLGAATANGMPLDLFTSGQSL